MLCCPVPHPFGTGCGEEAGGAHPEHGVTLFNEVQRYFLGIRSSPECSSAVSWLPHGQARGPRSPLSPPGVKVTPPRMTLPQRQLRGTGQSCAGSCCIPVPLPERDALHGTVPCSSGLSSVYLPPASLETLARSEGVC